MSKSKSKLTFRVVKRPSYTDYYIICGSDVYDEYGYRSGGWCYRNLSIFSDGIKCEDTPFKDMTIIYDLDKVDGVVFLKSDYLVFIRSKYDLEYILFVLKSLPSLPNKGSYTIEDDSNLYSDALTVSRSRGNYHVGCQTLSEKDRKTLIKAIEWHMSN